MNIIKLGENVKPRLQKKPAVQIAAWQVGIGGDVAPLFPLTIIAGFTILIPMPRWPRLDTEGALYHVM